MADKYKAHTLVELIVVMILVAIVMISTYDSIDWLSTCARKISASHSEAETLTDSLMRSLIHIQDSIYFAEQEWLRIQDKINEMKYDEWFDQTGGFCSDAYAP